MATMARLVAAPTSAQPFRSRQAALGHALPLGSYLLKPVQRILKYHLLLQNLVKQCTSHDTEYALYKMTGIAQHIDDMKGRHEHAVRVQEIQSLLYGWSGQDLTTYGELCAEGTFRVFGAKAMRHAFLFDKMLLLTKNKEYGILAYKTHIMCNNLMLVESIQGQPLSFHVIPFDCPRMQVTLQARNVRHKREWTLLLKRVILENYNAVIPSHARQLVMELGQNKTDDDMLAEKSATLISHSSMRKQLSAPEYLEKRKLERERRKSFESGLRHRLKRSAARKGQSANGSMEVDEDKDKSVGSESICDEEACNCYKEQEKCDSCSNLDDSNFELSKGVCSQCRRSEKHTETSWSNIDLCDMCQYDKDRSAFSDSNCDYEIKKMRKCRSCLENCHFQSQSSIDADFKTSRCPDCDKSMHFIDGSIGGSVDKSIGRCAKCSESNSSFNSRRNKLGGFKCSSEEVVSSQESSVCNGCLTNNVSYQNDLTKKQYDRLDNESGRMKNKESLNVKRTCLKCHEIRENITIDSSNNSKMSERDNTSSQCEHDDNHTDSKTKRISKDDSQTLTVPKTSGTLRRKSEPGMANINFDPKDWKKSVKNDAIKHGHVPSGDHKSLERCQDCGKAFIMCINCGKTVNGRRIRCIHKGVDRKAHSFGRDVDCSAGNIKNECSKQSVPEVKMYNAKTVPKKISKIKKSRAKTLRHYLASDSTAKFYADLSNEFATDNVLHISESTDSINTLNSNKNDEDALDCNVRLDADNSQVDDEELYRSLVQKTDSFKKSEIEKDKLMCAQNEVRNSLDDVTEAVTVKESPKDGEVDDDAFESCDDGQSEKPLELIISQLLMQNREFQKILKRHQLRNATNRRHQRLLKSHSNPEKVLAQNRDNQLKLKPKYGRQTSAVENVVSDEGIEHLEIVDDESADKIGTEYPKQYKRPPVEEHIYETLIVSPDKENTDSAPTDDVVIFDKDYSVPSSQSCLKTFTPKNQRNVSEVDLNCNVSTGLDVPSGRQTRVSLTESDYVYLCFEGKKTIDAIDVKDIVKNMQDFEDNGEYAVPNSSPIKVRKPDLERRATKDKIETKPMLFNNIEENYYDNTSEIWKRISNDTVIENPSFKAKTEAFNIDDYLDPENGSQNPNLPEVWLNRQKEHFTTPRNKKSGSLPRSFQVVVNDALQNCILKPVTKPGVLNKVYLNKDGKVLQTDRPFTIASDRSEISYEDIERFIKGEDESALKFPSDFVLSNRSSLFECDNLDNESVSRSTLELEAEIDRCYKNNFEYDLSAASNSNLLVGSSHIQSMDNSISSSMEVMNDKNETGISQEDISVHHPEHKIYKPNSNVLSLKGVLNRFKLKGRPSQEQQNSDGVNVADKEHGSEPTKSNGKTASAKKTASPKNYSRNLMQRFKSIINDEQFTELEKTGKLAPDDNNTSIDSNDINIKSNITVLVTNADELQIKNSDIVLSKSFCETTLPDSNIGSPDFVSKSCNDILSPMSLSRDNLNDNNVHGMSQSVQFPLSSNYQPPLGRSVQNSIQDLNKLPIYKQGSRHLGARIAQSDYADPKALFMTDSNSELIKVNVLINKNALRPDSLLSNSSHFTSSSEGCLNPNEVAGRNSSFLYRNSQSEVVKDVTTAVFKRQTSSASDQIIAKKIQIDRFLSLDPNASLEKHEDKRNDFRIVFKSNADDSFYEKSFEEIENLPGNEIFRDSAIYSDPEDGVYPSENDLEKKYRGFNSGNTLTRHKTDMSNTSFKINKTIIAANNDDNTKDSITAPALGGSQKNIFYTNANTYDTDKSIAHSKPDIKVKRTSSVHEKTTEIEKIIIANGKNQELEHSSKISNNSDIKTQKPISTKNISGVKLAPPVPAKPTYKPSSISKVTPRISSSEKRSLNESSSGCSMKLISQDQDDGTDERMLENDSKFDKLISGKLHFKLKLPEITSILAPAVRSPTEKLKLSIPRLNYERSTSSNIQIKRMSFERSSLDSSKINKRSRSVSSYETTENSLARDVYEDQVIVKSVQERRKEIEKMNSDVSVAERKNGNVDEVKTSGHRKSGDGLEHSSIAFSRSISVKTTAYDNSNNSAKDQSRIISKKNIPILKVPLQKCNIPIVNSSSKQNIMMEINSVNVDTIDPKNGATFEEKCSLSDSVTELKDTEVDSGASSNLQHRGQSSADVEKGGWVKHVVNRFQ